MDRVAQLLTELQQDLASHFAEQGKKERPTFGECSVKYKDYENMVIEIHYPP